MSEPKVVVAGNPDCAHRRFERRTLTMIPPIPQVRCSDCGRTLEWPAVHVEDKWPESVR